MKENHCFPRCVTVVNTKVEGQRDGGTAEEGGGSVEEASSNCVLLHRAVTLGAAWQQWPLGTGQCSSTSHLQHV